MLKIRLQRFGKKNQPFFRVVVGESVNGPKSGKFIETLGWYNPLKHERSLKHERIEHWLAKGAQVSNAMYNHLISEGLLKGKKKDVAARKKKGDEAAAEAPKGTGGETPPAEADKDKEAPGAEASAGTKEEEKEKKKADAAGGPPVVSNVEPETETMETKDKKDKKEEKPQESDEQASEGSDTKP